MVLEEFHNHENICYKHNISKTYESITEALMNGGISYMLDNRSIMDV